MALHPPLSAGPAGGWRCWITKEEHLLLLLRNTTAAGLLDICTCWFVSVCSLRLSPLTSGLARRRRRRGSWTGSLLRLSTSLAPDFGPGPEVAAEGRAAGRGVCLPRLSPPTSGPAWPGGGGGGVRSGTGSLLSKPLSTDFDPGPEAARWTALG